MRILMVVPSLRRGGTERVVATLSRQFAVAHETRVLVFNTTEIAYDFGGTLIDAGLKPVAGLGKVLNVLRRALAIRQHLQSFRPDLIISFTESANFPAVLAAVLSASCRELYISVRANPEILPWHTRWSGALLYRLPSAVVGCSNGVSDAVQRVLRLSHRQVGTIVNPVEVDLREAEVQSPLIRGVWMEKPYFVAVGRLDWLKGFDVLLHAWKLSRLSATYNLLVLGDGALTTSLNRLRTTLGLNGSVHFVGAVANPFPVMRQASAFVLSSRFEGWPNALAEAMALGLPVISTDCPFGPAELIRDENEGLLVPVEDPEALSRAMQTVARDPALRARLSERAKARTAELSPERIASQWLQLVAPSTAAHDRRRKAA